MIRPLTIVLTLGATAAVAQSERETAFSMMSDELASQGIPEDAIDGVVACFLDRLSDAEVTALISAADNDAREAVFVGMSNVTEAESCAGAVLLQ